MCCGPAWEVIDITSQFCPYRIITEYSYPFPGDRVGSGDLQVPVTLEQWAEDRKEKGDHRPTLGPGSSLAHMHPSPLAAAVSLCEHRAFSFCLTPFPLALAFLQQPLNSPLVPILLSTWGWDSSPWILIVWEHLCT